VLHVYDRVRRICGTANRCAINRSGGHTGRAGKPDTGGNQRR
jgi:hypothetical protein